jgi:hypothetical protein
MDIRHDQVFKGFVTQGAAMVNAVDWLNTRLWMDGEQRGQAPAIMRVGVNGFPGD